MSWRTYHWDDMPDDERHALLDGYGCGLCLDFGHLHDLGPCPRCRPDNHSEHLLELATALVTSIWTEEHDDWEAA